MTSSQENAIRVRKSLARRYRQERRFRLYGILSIGVGLLALVALFTDIIGKGTPAFQQTLIQLDLQFDAEQLGIQDASDPQQLQQADFRQLVRDGLRAQFPEVASRLDKKALYSLLSDGAEYQVQNLLADEPQLLGKATSVWLLASDEVDAYIKHAGQRSFEARLNEQQQSWLATLQQHGRLETRFNTTLFTSGDSREPEMAGMLGAVVGSLLTMVVTLCLSFPIGVAAAIYLEEFAPKNRWSDLIEVNINNLAAVPSIIFGLLGLAVFINLFGLPRSVPLVGGLVLTLMTLPTIIISSRAAIKSVPPSIREAAFGMGASRMQVVFHHVLPLALPGMLTGTIIGMAQALGETAPLLMIGMVAFIVDVPQGFLDPATVLPVQIFLWADSPEWAFVERTSAAIMVLLAFLISMNTLAVLLRRRLERRW